MPANVATPSGVQLQSWSCETVGCQPDVVASDGCAWRPALRLAQRDLGSVVGMRDRALGEAQTNRTLALSLAQLVILAVIPPGPTAADQTTLHGMPS